MKHVDFELFW